MRAIVPRDVGSYSYAGMGYANPHAVTSVGGTTYAYDNNGNVSAIGSLDYTWDWRNRLASAERSGGGTTSYGYDHIGRRVFKRRAQPRHRTQQVLQSRHHDGSGHDHQTHPLA
jgi:uncharacterized protein RhaS with RHS repeats